MKKKSIKKIMALALALTMGLSRPHTAGQRMAGITRQPQRRRVRRRIPLRQAAKRRQKGFRGSD